MNKTRRHYLFQLSVMILSGGLGVFLVLYCTSLYGLGVTPDSTCYLALAKSLWTEGMYFQGRPCVFWPPLFPGYLSVLSLLGVDPWTGGRFVHAIIYGLIVLSAGRLFAEKIRSRILLMLATVSLVLAQPVLHVCSYVWSGPMFILLLIWFIFYLSRFLQEGSLRLLVTAGLFGALGCLQRYIGVTMILTGLVLILLYGRQERWYRLLRAAAIFGAVSGAPLALWLLRNYYLTSTFTGQRFASETAPAQNIIIMLRVMALWFFHSKNPFSIILAGLIIITAVSAAVSLRRGPDRRDIEPNQAVVLSASVFVLIYIVFMITTSSIIEYETINFRLASPLYIFLLFLFYIGVEKTAHRATLLWSRPRLGSLIAIGLCGFWLTSYQLPRIYTSVSNWHKFGVGKYNKASWRETPLTRWLQSRESTERIYSNLPYLVEFTSGISAQGTPFRSEDLSQFRQEISASNDNYLIWYDVTGRRIYSLSELNEVFEFEQVKTFSQAVIYFIKNP